MYNQHRYNQCIEDIDIDKAIEDIDPDIWTLTQPASIRAAKKPSNTKNVQ